MITVTKRMTTETAHRLCQYEGKCAHIHGHSYTWEVSAALADKGVSRNGISIDFGTLKAAMRECIYDRFDHALVLWEQKDPMYMFREMWSKASDGSKGKIVWTPYNPTAEMLAEDVGGDLQEWFNERSSPEDNVVEIYRMRVWETADSYGQWLQYPDWDD